jgi:hypothetical protein
MKRAVGMERIVQEFRTNARFVLTTSMRNEMAHFKVKESELFDLQGQGNEGG